MDLFELSELTVRQARSNRVYCEFLRRPALSMGLYVLRAGETDPQRPHAEEEVYYIAEGRGMIRVGTEDAAVRAGTLVYVPAGIEHRFHTIVEDLRVVVIFAPAESA
jgi:mannose-6-phosphate isomerase-like protein (cupin superfamily)